MSGLFDEQHTPGYAGGAEQTTLRNAPCDTFASLRGRMLVHAGTRDMRWASNHRSVTQGGLIISGKGAAVKVGELRAADWDGILLADPGRYTDYFATTDAPFYSTGQGSLFSTGLDVTSSILKDELADQLGRGADFAVSPTGCIRAEDSGAFKAAARAITEFGDPRMIFAVPLNVTWLSKDRISQTIAILRGVPGLKAVMFSSQMDPLANKVVANLCRLLAEVPDVAVLRTDIAALGGLANGAVFTSFGVISSQRHLTPPKEPVQTGKRNSGGPKSPSVLYPELMSFYLGETIADRHADGSAPGCECDVCQGRYLSRFSTKAQGLEAEAKAHNVAIMAQWSVALHLRHAQEDPRAWWRQRCAAAVHRTAEVNVQLRETTGSAFAPCPQLAQWAAAGADEQPQH